MPAWVLWTIFAVVCWGLWAVLSKVIGDALSGPQSQALSTIGLLPIMAGLAFSRASWKGGERRTRGIVVALICGVISALGNVAYYQLLASGAKAATVVPLTALYPIVTIALAAAFLGEKLNGMQAAGVAASLLAIYFFNVPDEKGVLSGALAYATLPMVLWGVAGLLQKISTNDVSGEISALCFLAGFVPLAFLLLWREPVNFAALTARIWVLVLALGFFLALGNVAILFAFAQGGKASIIGPMGGLYPLVSVPIAIGLLGEHVGWREVLGIALAVFSVIALSLESKPASVGSEVLK